LPSTGRIRCYATLHLQGGNRIRVPPLYLIQTESVENLSFKNTHTNIVHSVIDFYVPDLKRYHSFLKEQGLEVGTINFLPGMEGKGGFGFKDPDGNLLSACNVTHQGQVYRAGLCLALLSWEDFSHGNNDY